MESETDRREKEKKEVLTNQDRKSVKNSFFHPGRKMEMQPEWFSKIKGLFKNNLATAT